MSTTKTLKGCHQTKKLLQVLMHNSSSVLWVNKQSERDETTSSAANSMLIWVLLSVSVSSRCSPGRAGPSCPRFRSHGVEMVFSSPEGLWQASVLPRGVPTSIAAPWGAPRAGSLPSDRCRAGRSVPWLLLGLGSVGYRLPMGVSRGAGWAEANCKGRSFSVHEGAGEDLGRRLGRWLAERERGSEGHKPRPRLSWAEEHLR